MRKHFYLLFLLIFFFSLTQAQTWRRQGGWGNQYTGIVWVNEEVGYISGDQVILKSIDGGLSWVEQATPIKAKMWGVDFFNETLGIMVGESGHIFRTSNGGTTWQLSNIGSDIKLNKVKYLSEQRIYIVADNGGVYRSNNSGETWTQQNIGTNADLKSLFFVQSDTGYITASDGQVFRSFNGGNSWALSNTGQNRSLNDVYFINGEQGYAVGNRGTILRTLNAGNSWSSISSGTDRDLFAVSFNRSNSNQGVITGEGATLLRTVNGGSTFEGRNTNNQENYWDVSFRANANVVFATGSNGFLISSNNSGGSWSVRLSGRDVDYTGLQFVSAIRGYLIGEEGRIFLTNNAGNSFADRTRPVSNDFKHLFFLTNSLGYVCGENGILLRTTNSGGNWTSLNPGTSENLNGLYFFNNNTGYVVGDKGFVAFTSDGGVSWQKIEVTNTDVDLKRLAFFDQDNGILIGSNGFVSVFENNEWKTITIGATSQFNDISIMDDNSAVIVGQSGITYKTDDKGQTWQQLDFQFTENLNAVEFLDDEIGFIAGEKGLMVQTKDGGETWEKFLTATFQDFTGISFGTLSNGFAVGEKGTFFTYDCQVPEQPTLIFGDGNVCLGQHVYNVQEALELDIEFEWRVDGGRIIEGQGTSRIVVEWDIPGRNAVLVRGKNFCGNSGTTGLEVIVSGTPSQINTIEGEGAVCVSTTEEYFIEETLGTIYVWEVTGGEIIAGQGTNRILVDWKNTGQHAVSVTPSNPCGQGQTANKEILVTTPPDKPSDITGPDRVGFTEETYSVTNVSEVNFQWRINDQGGRIIAGQGTNTVTVRWEKEGNYTLRVTPMNGCNEGESSEMEVNVNIITSIGENRHRDGMINIYPNPSQGDFTLDVRDIGQIFRLRLINAFGQEINSLVPEDGVREYQFRELPKGLYTVIIHTAQKDYVKKVLVR